MCYEALAAYYPRLASQYRVTPPEKPARLLAWQKLKESKSSPTTTIEISNNDQLSEEENSSEEDSSSCLNTSVQLITVTPTTV